MDPIAPTGRTQVRRLPTRGIYDRHQIYSILDEAIVCHVGFVVDGQPYVIPTGYARLEDVLYIHGSSASRMLRTLGSAVQLCITVTLVDGLVLARSAFHHSMNYRSVVVLGTATVVTEPEEKVRALAAFTDHIVPDRWDEVRIPTEQELKATVVLRVPIEEASAKVRTGPPVDDEEDYELPVWAGVVPLRTQAGEPVPDGRVKAGVAPFDTARLQR